MPVYPIRLSEELYEKLCERAQQEGRPVASLLRESASAAVGNPSVSSQLAMIREDIVKSSCSSDVNRATLLAAIETLTHGDFDSKSFEEKIKIYEIMLFGVRYHGIEKVDELREFVRGVLKEESENK